VEEMAKAMKAKDGLSEMLGVRVSTDDLTRIDALAQRIEVGTRHSIARAALRIGLDAIERDPAILLRGAVKARKPPSR
jgi:hypothetical protein